MVSSDKPEIRWAGLLLIKNRRVLMVKELGKGFFMLPGGRVDKEETIEETLRRELKEDYKVYPIVKTEKRQN